MMKNPELFSWITVLNNLIELDESVRKLFFELYFEKVQDLKSNGFGGFNYDQEGQESNYLIIQENANRGNLFLMSLFHSAYYYQKVIRKEVFHRSFLFNHQSYFTICLVIKNLAEDNFLPMKEYVGSQGKETDKNASSLLDIFFEGIYFNLKPKPHYHTYSRRDRPDLIWFNVVSLETIIEYFSGPCRKNL